MPIEASSELLNKDMASTLRAWLAKPERKTLELIVASKSRKAQCEALFFALGSDQPTNEEASGPRLASGAIREAHRYETFLAILKEIDEALDKNSVEITKVR